jgi:hypothetical protein
LTWRLTVVTVKTGPKILPMLQNPAQSQCCTVTTLHSPNGKKETTISKQDIDASNHGTLKGKHRQQAMEEENEDTP